MPEFWELFTPDGKYVDKKDNWIVQRRTKIIKLVEKINQALLSNIRETKTKKNMKKKVMVNGLILNWEFHERNYK